MTKNKTSAPYSIWYTDELLPDDLIKLLPKKTVYGFNVGCDVLLVTSMNALRKMWGKLSLDTEAMVVVFDTSIHTKRWSIPKLDLTKPVMMQLKQPTRLQRLKTTTTPIDALLSKTAKSFVSNFLTLSYKYDDPIAVRVSVFNAVATDNVERLLKSVPKSGYADLIALVTSNDAKALTAGLNVMKHQGVAQASKTTGVSTFDLLYVSKFITRQPITSIK